MTTTTTPETERICQLLLQMPLFNDLSSEEAVRFVPGVREMYAAKGETLFYPGDPCTGFHLIITGQVKLSFLSSDGHEKVIEILGNGHTFGEAIMFVNKPYMVMAQALMNTHLLHISQQTMFNEIAREPQFSRKIIAGLSRRLHQLIADVESYSLRNGRDRVISYLLHEEKQTGEPVNSGRTSIHLPANKYTIASLLNLTQEHFSRILHELISANLIEVKGRIIHVPDISRLRDSLGEPL